MSTYFLHSILPALRVREPITCGPVVFCTTKHLAGYTLEPPTDVDAVRQVATQFRDAFGRSLNCLGLELVPADVAKELGEEGLPRACRDAVALSHMTNGAAFNCYHEQRLTVYESDYFDALPIWFRPNGFVIQRPGKLGLCIGLDDYQPALRTDISEPDESDFHLDELLLKALSSAVGAMLAGQHLRELRQIFRAVAISMYGCRILHETDSTYYDLGPRSVAWVSAFETLVHPGVGQVRLDDVLALVGQIRWVDDGKLRPGEVERKSGTLKDALFSTVWSGKTYGPEIAPANYYRRLNNLRNDLAHGNPIDPSAFAACPDHSKGPRLEEIASLLFRECVLERFRDLDVIQRTRDGSATRPGLVDYIKEPSDARHYHEALSKALFGRHWHRNV